MLHVMPFMGPDLEINSILFYSILYIDVWAQGSVVTGGGERHGAEQRQYWGGA